MRWLRWVCWQTLPGGRGSFRMVMRLLVCLLLVVGLGCGPVAEREDVTLLAVYWPTPDAAVARMLEMADLQPGETLYDLGSGDGRIVIAAAQEYGVRAVGIEIDSELVAQSRASNPHSCTFPQPSLPRSIRTGVQAYSETRCTA